MNFYRIGLVEDFIGKFILPHARLRSFLTRLFVKEEVKEITLLGSNLCINTVQEIGYLNTWNNSTSSIVFKNEVPSLLNLCLILEPTDTFVDIGANVGLYSSVIGRLLYVFPNMRFYAFEANPLTVDRLKKTLQDKSVEVECLALSDKNGSLSFTQGAASNTFASAENAPSFNDKSSVVNVKALRLDNFPLQGASLVLKIDVEGHEWQVLQGSLDYFKAKRIKAVFLDGFNDSRIPSFLESHGFKRFHGRTLQGTYPEHEGTLFLHQDWLQKYSATKPA